MPYHKTGMARTIYGALQKLSLKQLLYLIGSQ